MSIRQAKTNEFEAIMQFYYDLISDMKDAEFKPGWEKDVYPSRESVMNAIKQGELFIAEENDGSIISAMILNHNCTEGYETADWGVEAEPDKVISVHAFGVSHKFHGKGLAKKLINDVIEHCRTTGMTCIRLDVLGGNVPASKLYESVGFKYIKTLKLFYEDTGLTDFLLYEYIL